MGSVEACDHLIQPASESRSQIPQQVDIPSVHHWDQFLRSCQKLSLRVHIFTAYDLC
jgi:hypothetical protein